MADGRAILPVIDPETREGRSVSILTDRRLIVRAFENGWIDDVEIAREIRDEAREDMKAYEAVNPPPDELLDRRMALAKIAQGAANMTAKAVSTADGAGQPREGDKHIHFHGERDPRTMTDSELDAYIAEQRRRIEG